MLHDGQSALVVDPGDAQPVLHALVEQGLTLKGILVTHHHIDHVGGVSELAQRTQARVWGPAAEVMPEPITRLSDSAEVAVLGLQFRVMHIPGHTAGHIAYFCRQTPLGPLLFCGDTLFSGGCGRLFEGSPGQMLNSLKRLSALPDATMVCCAHEYTLHNLRFAREVDSENSDLAGYQRHCQDIRSKGLPTLPSTIGLERKINPFLRCDTQALQRSMGIQDTVANSELDTFTALRASKNHYQ